MILAVISILMIAVFGILESYVRNIILSEGIEKGRAIANSLSSAVVDPIQSNDDLALFAAVNGITSNRGVIYGFIVDTDGLIKAHSDIKKTGTKHLSSGEVFETGSDAQVTIIRGADIIYDISVPVKFLGGSKLGESHIGFSKKVVDEVVSGVRVKLTYLAFLALFFGGAGAVILSSLLVKPIKILVDGVKKIGEGNLDQRIDIKRSDEIGDLTDAFNDMAKGLEEREFIKSTFQKFVHKDIVNDLLKNPDKIRVGGEKKKVTILFADIRGFTSISEKLSPEEIISMLNEYFAASIKIINEHGGVLDKFIGDAMMITFGVPVEAEDDPIRAVKTALLMRKRVEELNATRSDAGKTPIKMGFGINTGYVIAGNVGSEDRMEYTVLGDVVNTASRIEGLSRNMEVLVTESTYDEVKDLVKSTEKGESALKGKSGMLKIYEIDEVL